MCTLPTEILEREDHHSCSARNPMGEAVSLGSEAFFLDSEQLRRVAEKALH